MSRLQAYRHVVAYLEPDTAEARIASAHATIAAAARDLEELRSSLTSLEQANAELRAVVEHLLRANGA